MNRRSIVVGLYDFKVNFFRLDFLPGFAFLWTLTAFRIASVVTYGIQRGLDDQDQANAGNYQPGGHVAPRGEKARVYQGYPEKEQYQ
jgi:hypothetical protein